MREIKVPVDLPTKFSHFCEDCSECTFVFEHSYGHYYILTCSEYKKCSRLWQHFSEKGLVRKKDVEQAERKEENGK